jgi:hypothetical protein
MRTRTHTHTYTYTHAQMQSLTCSPPSCRLALLVLRQSLKTVRISAQNAHYSVCMMNIIPLDDMKFVEYDDVNFVEYNEMTLLRCNDMKFLRFAHNEVHRRHIVNQLRDFWADGHMRVYVFCTQPPFAPPSICNQYTQNALSAHTQENKTFTFTPTIQNSQTHATKKNQNKNQTKKPEPKKQNKIPKTKTPTKI